LAGRYQLKKRAERQAETRRRIVEAAVALHTTVGPARTTDQAIAERAGVTRVTFYRHFPDDVSLFRACKSHGLEKLPPPDPVGWRRFPDPEDRLRTGLLELYDYYRIAGPALVVVRRDAAFLSPEINALPSQNDALRLMPDVLLDGWRVRGKRRALLSAAIHHACAITTWQSLVQQHGLSDEEAVELLVAMTTAAAFGSPGVGDVRSNPWLRRSGPVSST